jgi:hypothetical protein
MADRQRTPLATADGIPQRLPEQAAANASAPSQGLAKRTGERIAVWVVGKGAECLRGHKAPLTRSALAEEAGRFQTPTIFAPGLRRAKGREQNR